MLRQTTLVGQLSPCLRNFHDPGLPACAPPSPPPFTAATAATAGTPASDDGPRTSSSCCSWTGSIATFLLDTPPAPATALALRRASASLSWEPLLRLLEERGCRRRPFPPPGTPCGEPRDAPFVDGGGQHICRGSREGMGWEQGDNSVEATGGIMVCLSGVRYV